MLTRNLSRVIVTMATLALPMASIASVRAAGPTGSYSSGITCVNLGAASASMAVTFYSTDNGTAITTYSVPSAVAPKNSVYVFTPNVPGLGASLQGSAVVSSDQQVACTAEAQRTDGTVGIPSNPARAATTEAFSSDQASNILYASQVIKTLGNASSGIYDSYVSVQNIESSAVSVTLSYVNANGVAFPAANETVSIPPQSAHVFYQNLNANLPTGFIGSAKITTSDPAKKVAATVMGYNDGLTTTHAQMLGYNASGTGGNKLTFPQWVRNYYGFNSGANIMNVGVSTTTVTMTFNFNGVPYARTNTIGPLQVVALFAKDITQTAAIDALAVNLRTGSVIFQASPGGSIIANINARNDGTCFLASCPAIPANFVGAGVALNAFVDGTATTKAIVGNFPRAVGGSTINGGFTIVNATTNAGTCDLEYVGHPTANQLGVVLAASGNIGRFAPNVVNLPNGSSDPVSITCTQPVFVNANTRSDLATYVGDSNTSWNVQNIP